MNHLASWRYAFASVIGTSHVKSDAPCQDASSCRLLETPQGEPVLVAVVADGAGSASHAQIGAEMACHSFVAEVERHLQDDNCVTAWDERIARAWINGYGRDIDIRAEAEGLMRRDYACTILAVIIGSEAAITMQIGDGAIVVEDPSQAGSYCYLFWPQRGEYENVTVFLTDEKAGEYLQYGKTGHPIHEVALFTDGIQRLVLQFQDRSVHDPFFRPLFAPLRSAEPGFLGTLSASLGSFLQSEPVNLRTDDDKTLVLATRRPAVGQDLP